MKCKKLILCKRTGEMKNCFHKPMINGYCTLHAGTNNDELRYKPGRK